MKIIATHRLADMHVEYWQWYEGGPVGLRLLPTDMPVPHAHRTELTDKSVQSIRAAFGMEAPAAEASSLVQIHATGDPRPNGFVAGRTLTDGAASTVLEYAGQESTSDTGQTSISTRFRHPTGIAIQHELRHTSDTSYLVSRVSIRNEGEAPVTIDHLASFCLSGFSPWQTSEASGAYAVHRFRGGWCADARHDMQTIEALNAERAWLGSTVRGERFGQAGSIPVRQWHPWLGLEDREHGVFWAAHLGWAGSWQMEYFRRGDWLNMSGGLADWEFGHWRKTLAPGDSFTTPEAALTCCRGNLDVATQRLTQWQRQSTDALPASEHDLPIQFNDFCTTWLQPEPELLLNIADRIKETETRYFVIDDGWFQPSRDAARTLGDWVPSDELYPQGLGGLAKDLRGRGFIPGLWFEMETCCEPSETYHRTNLLLHLDGEPLTIGQKRFLDFRKPEVQAFLHERVARRLADDGFDYIKVDYNEGLGIGVDGAESLGEGLRQHIEGVQRFFAHLREEVPELVIENCCSGGNRLEPSMMAVSSLGLSSDAVESHEGVIIAAQHHYLLQPRQLLVWATLRAGDSIPVLHFRLAGCFLGRFAFTGDILELDDAQFAVLAEATRLYRQAWRTIDDGFTQHLTDAPHSYRKPKGYQAILRTRSDAAQALVVVHNFSEAPARLSINLPGPDSWVVTGSLMASGRRAAISEGALVLEGLGDWEGAVVLLESVPDSNTH